MSERFYLNCPLRPGPVEIQGAEAHHLNAVCRLRPGDRVCLFNGDGHEYAAEIVSVSRRSASLNVRSRASPSREVDFPLELAAPLPKGDRAQFLLEKLTELGVTQYVPLRTERSVLHPGENRLEKLHRYVIEASKQCGRNFLLQIHPVMGWRQYCEQKQLPVRILAHPLPQEERATGQTRSLVEKAGLALAVGPEGGLTEDEVAFARAKGWQAIDLGPRTLRVETAALVLASWALAGRFPTSVPAGP